MLNKLRRRFIMAAMAATCIVLSTLLVAINIINYSQTTKQLDRTLDALSSFNNEMPGPFDIEAFAQHEFFGGSPAQAQSAAIFFSVTYDDRGITSVDNNFISSITEKDAVDYANDVREEGSEYGYYHEYRYRVVEATDKTVVLFLNAATYVRQFSLLTSISFIVALASMLAVFALTVLLSKRAIVPYMKNIELQKQFITNASHELKTPLTAIATCADVLSMENGDNEWVAHIQEQAERLSKLVGNLVTLSRLNEEIPFPNKMEFSLTDVLWKTVEPYEMLAKGKGKTLTQSIEDGLTLTGDREAIQQLVSILLENAVKYSAENGSIQLSAARKGRKNLIEITNTCEMKDISELDRLFDRFYRPDKSRSASTGGSGIGLSIAKATVEGHGGAISVESKDGKEIKFTVVL